MRRNKKESGASLDSLLDTLTNVVGILVILVTVMQLGVSEAVQRIAKTDSVRPEVYEQALAKRIELMRQRVELEKRLEVFKKADRIDLRVLLHNIENLEASLAVLLEGKEKVDLEMLELRKHRKKPDAAWRNRSRKRKRRRPS